MRLQITSIAIAAALALTACGDSATKKSSLARTTTTTAVKAGAKYPAAIEHNFMSNCERTSHGRTKACRCILDELESRMNLAEFTAEDTAVALGRHPSRRFTDAVAACR